LFLDAATKVIERGLIPNAKFVWVGDGPDIEQYRCAARDPKLLGRVQFVGFRDDASELMAAADVFYLSSREDPFPLVCLEAGQFAVPSLYFEGTTGISEFTGSDAGIGVPSFDTDKICSTLYLLARHPVTLMRLGEVARARVMAGYTAEIKISQIAQHVQNVTRFVPDVSVIVPAYNHADYIQERLNSILTQTIQDFEVIVLDDLFERCDRGTGRHVRFRLESAPGWKRRELGFAFQTVAARIGACEIAARLDRRRGRLGKPELSRNASAGARR
jgi:hypothetical protein